MSYGMQIVDVKWTSNVNILLIQCDCGHQFGHKSNKWIVWCPICNRQAKIGDLRNEYVEKSTGRDSTQTD